MNATKLPDGLSAALCAMSFFRMRFGEVKGRRKIRRDMNAAAQNRRLCRQFIADARKHGFRGSVTAATLAHYKNNSVKA